MNILKFPILLLFLISSCLTPILAQQPYVGKATTACDVRDNSTTVLGYSCNGLRPTCQSYLTFRSQPPYNTVAAISNLLSANSSEVSEINSVSENATFQTNQIVLVPVTCSCTGNSNHYQVNASYTVQPRDTFLIIANNTFQGLSTCQAIEDQNNLRATNLLPGNRATVPLRCACPTSNQTSDAGVNYLLSYLIVPNDDPSKISTLFGVDTSATLAANELSEDSTIYPYTTLLIPLQNPPSASQLTSPPPPPAGNPPPPPTSSTPASGGSKTWVYVVVGVVGGFLLAAVIGGALFYIFFLKKTRAKNPKPVPLSPQRFQSAKKPLKNDADVGMGADSQDFLESLSSIAQSLKVYPFQELKSATGNFDPNCLIKGSVYRGLINGDYAAIKKMSGGDIVSKEINLLNKINHFNVIRLSGISFDDGHWYLVYEYASNGPLTDWIHTNQTVLDWNKRVQIALDVAAGLNYLHLYTTPPHVHKDLNSSNILLDHNFRAKVASLSLARSAEGQEGEFALTRHIIGTKGYMAPEYLEHGVVSTKLDVYAFGVLLLEILTGKQVSALCEEVVNMRQISEVLTPVLHEDNGCENLRNVMDPCLGEKYPPDLALVLLRLIDGCLKKDPADRPDMDDVFQSLSRISSSGVSGEWAVSISEQGTAPR